MSNITASLKGRYKIVVRDSVTLLPKRETDWFDNLITTAGLNRIGLGGIGDAAFVGSGSTPPSFADTALAAPVGSTSSVVTSLEGAQASSPYFGWMRRTYRFNPGAATGNLAEVGIGWTGSGGGIFSRALIRDSEDNPTTITVLSDETLDVIYELRLYPPTADVNFDLTLDGVTHACVMRAAMVNEAPYWTPRNLFNFGSPNTGTGTVDMLAMDGPIGLITESPSASNQAEGDRDRDPYVNNSMKRSLKFTWELNAANYAGGIQSFFVRPNQGQYPLLGSFQIGVTPAIMKNNTKTLVLNCEISWARKT